MKVKQTQKKQDSKTDPTIPVAKQRSKGSPIEVTGHFKSLGSEFIIKATPEAWLKLQKKCFDSPETYQYIRKGLFEDLWPFIYTAHEKAQNWTPGEGKKNFQKALYVQAALINDIMSYYLNEERDQDKSEYEVWRETYKLFDSVWREDKEYVKRKVIIKKGSDPIKTFAKQYIVKGREIMKGDREELKHLLGSLISFMLLKKEKDYPGFKSNKSFQTVYDMTVAVEALVSGRGEAQFISQIVGVKPVVNPKYKGIITFIGLARKAYPFLK
jgi:hypothetical protein